MKTGGGLNYVVGPMGSGKSYYAVRKTSAALLAGMYVVTNVRLHDDAFDRIAKHTLRANPLHSHGARVKLAARLRAHYVFEESLQEAMRYRLPGTGEGRGLFIWDEGHNDLNNREWKQEGRGDLLKWATQLRKLGFIGYLLSQSAENTDAQLRRICNFAVKLQNQREQTRTLGIRVTPWPLFLASWFPTHVTHGSKTKPVRVERYFLNWQRRLYDTHGLYHGLDGGDDLAGAIVLPAGGRRPVPSEPAAILPHNDEGAHSGGALAATKGDDPYAADLGERTATGGRNEDAA